MTVCSASLMPDNRSQVPANSSSSKHAYAICLSWTPRCAKHRAMSLMLAERHMPSHTTGQRSRRTVPSCLPLSRAALLGRLACPRLRCARVGWLSCGCSCASGSGPGSRLGCAASSSASVSACVDRLRQQRSSWLRSAAVPCKAERVSGSASEEGKRSRTDRTHSVSMALQPALCSLKACSQSHSWRQWSLPQ